MSIPADPVEFAQNRFAEEIQKVQGAIAKLNQGTMMRRIVAYGVKGIAVLGGVMITLGLLEEWSRYIGAAITVAVAVDYISSNHRRLLALTEAKYAYSTLLNAVDRTHTRRLADVLALKQAAGDAAARPELLKLLKELLDKLHTKENEIEALIQRADLEGLRQIAVDQQAIVKAEQNAVRGQP